MLEQHSFQEVMKQKKRMCQSVLCCKCDIYLRCGQELSRCQPFIDNNPQGAEEIIMRWAAEHLEPVYPTWIEWLQSLGVIPYLSGYVAKRDDDGNYLDGHVNVNEVAHKPIPADIAQKLGIDPKEG